MKNVVQSPFDAVLAWYVGNRVSEFSLTGFTPYRYAGQVIGDIRIDVTIIGESDAVVISRNQTPIFVEFLACATPAGEPSYIARLSSSSPIKLTYSDAGIWAKTTVQIQQGVDRRHPPHLPHGTVHLEKPFGPHKPRTVVSVNVRWASDCWRIDIRSRHDYLTKNPRKWDIIMSHSEIKVFL